MNYQHLFLLCTVPLLFACTKKSAPAPTPTPTPRLVQLSSDQYPHLSLIPRADGRSLKFRLNQISPDFSSLEYELIYTATDGEIQIEKGYGDEVKIEGTEFERDLLLGTESCTNGCKYKYDEGVTGGQINLTFYTKTGQVATYQTPFRLVNSTDINSLKKLDLEDQFSVGFTSLPKNIFLIVLKNNQKYSVFSSSPTKTSLTLITPSDMSKDNLNQIEGEYLLP